MATASSEFGDQFENRADDIPVVPQFEPPPLTGLFLTILFVFIDRAELRVS